MPSCKVWSHWLGCVIWETIQDTNTHTNTHRQVFSYIIDRWQLYFALQYANMSIIKDQSCTVYSCIQNHQYVYFSVFVVLQMWRVLHNLLWWVVQRLIFWLHVVYLVMSCAGGSSLIYQLNDDSTSSILFTRVWQGPPTVDFYPVVIVQPAGPLVMIADAPVSSGSSPSPSPTVWQMSSLGTSDFVPRSLYNVLPGFCYCEFNGLYEK